MQPPYFEHRLYPLSSIIGLTQTSLPILIPKINQLQVHCTFLSMGNLNDMSATTPSMVRSFQASNPNLRLLGGFNNYYDNSIAINNHLPMAARVIVAAKAICHF